MAPSLQAAEPLIIESGPLAGQPTLGDRAQIVDLLARGSPVVSAQVNDLNEETGLLEVVGGGQVDDASGTLAGMTQLGSARVDLDGDGGEEFAVAGRAADGRALVAFPRLLAKRVSFEKVAIRDPANEEGLSLFQPQADPYGDGRAARTLHLVAGHLDTDPEDELVPGYWDADERIQIVVYDTNGAAFPPWGAVSRSMRRRPTRCRSPSWMSRPPSRSRSAT